MTKSEEIIESMDLDDLRILLLCFSRPKVMEAMRIYNVQPGHSKEAFHRAGKARLEREGLVLPASGEEGHALLGAGETA
ncbi:hypothetical protein KAR91_33370 [Candidatus Pacearchaeota archaeon]|nr:hypothetical protein [Candidatus Pacearchaeota archaeon]